MQGPMSPSSDDSFAASLDGDEAMEWEGHSSVPSLDCSDQVRSNCFTGKVPFGPPYLASSCTELRDMPRALLSAYFLLFASFPCTFAYTICSVFAFEHSKVSSRLSCLMRLLDSWWSFSKLCIIGHQESLMTRDGEDGRTSFCNHAS